YFAGPFRNSETSVEAAAAILDGLVGLRRQRAAGAVGAVGTHADDPIAVGWAGAGLERLDDGVGIALGSTHAGLAVDGDQFHAFRNLKVDIGRAVERDAHEILEDRRGETATRGAFAKAARRVVAHIEANDEVRREAYEPGVLLVIGRAGLAGDVAAELGNGGAGTALHDAFHHRGDLVGGHGVEHLLGIVDQFRLRLVLPFGGVAALAAAFVLLEDGLAIAILDAVDQRRFDRLAAIGHDRIGRHHAHDRRLAGAQR